MVQPEGPQKEEVVEEAWRAVVGEVVVGKMTTKSARLPR